LWSSAAMELSVAVSIAPLLVARLSSPDYPVIVATDASMTGYGVVSFTPYDMDSQLVLPVSAPHLSLQSVQIIRPTHARATDRQPVLGLELESKESYFDRKSTSTFVSVSEADWRKVFAGRWRRSEEHINSLEMRALIMAVRWVLSHRDSVGSRLSVLCDSMVVIGAVRKGRSSSQPLLRRLRALSSLVLSSGLSIDIEYVPSEFNPADECSRQ
jgi:hypothetical protein